MRRLAILFLAFLWVAPAASAGQRDPGYFLVFFQPWSAELDGDSQQIIHLAVEKMKTDSRVTVLGYADLEGSHKANLDLAKERVEAVRQLLLHEGCPDEQITVKAVGSVAPLGDAQESRRVEITIRTP